MPLELEIIRASEFIRLGTSGKFDLASTCAALAKIAQVCRQRGIYRALIDVRNSEADLSPSDIASLVSTFHDAGFDRKQRLAVLHPVNRYQRARLFALISRLKGWSVWAFDKFEDALCWLSEYQEETEAREKTHSKRLRVSHHDEDTKPVAIKSHQHHKPVRRPHVAHHLNRHVSSYAR